MSTEPDEYGVFHIDGPPYRGFVVADGKNRVEVIYKMFMYIGASEAEVREGCENLLSLVRSELNDLWEIQKETFLLHKIIWWRRRPEFTKDPESDRWKFTARFDTTPAISRDFWDRWTVPEGGFAKNVRDLL